MKRILAILVLALSASAHPGSSIAVAPDGRVYFVDTGGGVFSIERDGRVVRREGPAFHWFALDADERFAHTPWPSIPGAEFVSAGPVVLSSDYPAVVGTDGVFYYAQEGRLTGIRPSGESVVRAAFPQINGLANGPDGAIYFTHDAAVGKIDAKGKVTMIAHGIAPRNCETIPGSDPADGPYLRGLAVAPDGTVYVAAAACGRVLAISPRGHVTAILRTKSPWSPTAVAYANGELFVLEYLHTEGDDRRRWLPRVRKVDRQGKVTTLTVTKSR